MLPLSTLMLALSVVGEHPTFIISYYVIQKTGIILYHFENVSAAFHTKVPLIIIENLWHKLGADFAELQIFGQDYVYCANTNAYNFKQHPYRHLTVFHYQLLHLLNIFFLACTFLASRSGFIFNLVTSSENLLNHC